MKKLFIAFGVSFVLFWIFTPLRAWHLVYASIIETIGYSITTYYLLHKYSKSNADIIKIVLCIILGRIALELPIRFVDYDLTRKTLMVVLLAVSSIALTGLSFYVKRAYIVVLSLLLWGYGVFIGHSKWLNYVSFGSLPDETFSSFVVQTSNDSLSLGSLNAKYIMLDFWNSDCGICRKEFPHFQKVYDKYKEKVQIASVFIIRKKNQTIQDAQSIIQKGGYDFPVWAVEQNDTLLKTLEIKYVPIVVILDEKKNVVYKGNLEDTKKKLQNFTNN